MLYSQCVCDSKARSHWLNRGHVDEFKSDVTRLVNISKIIDQPVNIAVALSRLRAGKVGGKIDGRAYLKFVFAILTTVFIQKQKWRTQRNVLLILQKMKLENYLQKKTLKTLNTPQGLLYVCISTLILVINLFCFNNCVLLCLCYITKHLMTALSGNICFVSLESKHRDSRGNKTDVSLVSSH